MTDCSCSNFPATLGNVTFGASVGIGTTAPTAPLCIAGAVGAASTGFAALGGQRWRLQQASGDEANAGCLDYRGFDAGSLSIVGAGATGPVLNRNVRVYDTLTIGYSAPTGAVAAFDGNVGIGTDSPAESLELGSGGNIGIRIDPGSDTAQGLVAYVLRSREAGDYIRTWKIYTAPVGGGYGVPPNGFAIWDYPGNPTSVGWCCNARLVIQPTPNSGPSAPPVTIDGAGRLGVALDSPAHRLDVNGDINTSGNLLAGGYKVADSNGSYYA